jgi:hypothetical protein
MAKYRSTTWQRRKQSGRPVAGRVARSGRRPTSPAGISRIDQASTRTHGFFVRVGYHRTRDGAWRPKHRSFFGDAGHGGKAKALKAATKWLKSVGKK